MMNEKESKNTSVEDVTSDNEDIETTSEKPPPPKSVETLFTPEELKLREERRLKKSACCLRDAWDLYKKLTDPLGAKGEDGEKMDIADNAAAEVIWGRVEKMEHKLAAFRRALHLLVEAAHPPFARICESVLVAGDKRALDVKGRGKRIPGVTRNFNPEMSTDHDHPRTQAYRKQTNKVTHTTFHTLEDEVDTASTKAQTEDIAQFLSTKVVKEPVEELKAQTEDIAQFLSTKVVKEPVEELKGSDILPIPTYHERFKVDDPSVLFCCKKYMQACDESSIMEQKMLAEKESAEFFIDISPHYKYEPTTDTLFPDGMFERAFGHKKDKDAGQGRSSGRGRLDDDYYYDKDGRMRSSQQKPKSDNEGRGRDGGTEISRRKTFQTSQGMRSSMGKDAKGSRTYGAGKFGSDSRFSLSGGRKKRDIPKEDKAVDTFTLPWDPYETRFHHPRYFNDAIFDEGLRHSYRHPYVKLSEVELYTPVSPPETGRSKSRSKHSHSRHRVETSGNPDYN